MSFSESLKTFRESTGLSQYQFAKKSGVNHSYVSRLEAGSRQPTREMVQNFARVLELNPPQAEYLFRQAGFVYNDQETPVEDTARLTLRYAGYPDHVVERIDIIWRNLIELANMEREDTEYGNSYASVVVR